MRSFGGSPRSPRMKGAHLAVGHPAYGGVVIDVIERGHRGGKHESGILLTDEVRRELIRELGGTPDAAEPDKLREMAKVIGEVIAHYREYDELDEPWLAETARRLREMAK